MDEIISNVIMNDKKDLVIKDENTLFQLTSSDNQNNNQNNNISSIILGECENILKKKYKIDENQPLLILKIDYFQQDSLIPIIGYEVYHPINKTKLDLNYCKDANINLNIPALINENDLFKYDPNNEYYKDECIPSSTDSGTDILVNDRQNEFNDNNMALCEKNCTYNGYEINSKIAKCECGVKNKELIVSDLINQTDLSYNFTDNGSSKMISMKCYNTLFTKKGLIKNIGSYILLFIIAFFIISSIWFYKCGYTLLEDIIREIIDKKNKNKNIHFKETIENKTNIKSKIIKKSKKMKKNSKVNKQKFKKKKKGDISNKLNLESNVNSNSKSIINLKSQKILSLNEKKKFNNKNKINKNKYKDPIDYNDYDLNSMSYLEAKKYDKRKFFDYYISLIRTKNILIFSFCPLKDYNSTIIKISFFFLFFSIYYFINALFFDEKTIHKIYEDEGLYNFIYLIPYISYSFVISHTLNTIIKYIFLSERDIYKIKIEKNIGKMYDILEKVKRCLIIKYICYFISSIIFLSFFWYYLSSFGAVYQNTQIYLIKNTLISFGFSLFYPFVINLLPGMLRKCSMKGNKSECLYKTSKFIHII